MKKIITLTLLLMMSSLFMAGQNNIETNKEKEFSFKIGKWKWNVKGLAAYGDPKTYNGTADSHIYYINDSLATIDEHTITWEHGVVTKAITYRTYDSINNKYMVVFAQANSSYSAIIEGYWEDEKFVEIEKGTDKYGEWVNRMEIYDIKKDSHKAKLVRSYKSGFKITIIEYDASRIVNK
ncbi:hypothetical protein [Psychroserpens sp.]